MTALELRQPERANPSPGTGAPPAIAARRLRAVLGDQPVLRGLDLAVPAGCRMALVGPNGAGKSTLLRVLSGLLRPASGEVTILGRSLAADPWHARRSIGMVAHQAMLHPDLTAQENLTVFAELYGLDRIAERVQGGLDRVGLTSRAHARAATLSRGMLQRLALARALLHEPPILLLDEAESGLDSRAHAGLLAALGDRETGRTALLASHDLQFVAEVADRVAFLRAGRIVQVIPMDDCDARSLQERYAAALAAPPSSRAAPVARAAG